MVLIAFLIGLVLLLILFASVLILADSTYNSNKDRSLYWPIVWRCLVFTLGVWFISLNWTIQLPYSYTYESTEHTGIRFGWYSRYNVISNNIRFDHFLNAEDASLHDNFKASRGTYINSIRELGIDDNVTTMAKANYDQAKSDWLVRAGTLFGNYNQLVIEQQIQDTKDRLK